MSSPAPARTRRQSPSPTRTPARTKPPSRTRRRILAVTSLGLAGLLAGLLSGCATGTLPGVSTPVNSYIQASGNWQFSSAAAGRLSSVGGSLVVGSRAADGTTPVSGIVHSLSNATGQCLDNSTALSLSGSIDASGRLTLSTPVAGGILTLSGTLATDRRSLSAATYTIVGGGCASSPQLLAATAHDTLLPVTAQQYQPVNGTYSGTLTTAEGEKFLLTSTLTQTSQPDTSGVYHVQGSASSPGNTCVPTSLSATASTIDGGSISTTYSDSLTGTTITGNGFTSPDGVTITITNWMINSLCGQDSGTGVLVRQ